uniref:SHSP domain-containing protein n=1 Tax=Plectus sambesii TaxID=2011161 RepID=A0A914WIN7_9BILA
MGDVIQTGHDWVGAQWDWPLQQNDGVVKMINNKEKFEVGLDCQYFAPKEIEVRVNGENIQIHARHESRSDELGEILREVNRTYRLPQDIDILSLKSHLSSRGILTISAKKK